MKKSKSEFEDFVLISSIDLTLLGSISNSEDEFDQCNSVSVWTFLFHNPSCKLNIKATEHFETKFSILSYFATFDLFLFYVSFVWHATFGNW